jgi:hypothetical protein
MNKIIISALLSISLYGCATGNVNKVTLADLTARNIGVDDKTVTIKEVEVKHNYGFIPPPVYYEWTADTPKGQYRCNTSKDYQMGAVINQSGGCQKISN